MDFRRDYLFRDEGVAGSDPATPTSKNNGLQYSLTMPIEWADLSEDERTALKRMNRGPYPNLDRKLAERLIALGLAAERPRGVGISREGRELVINTLLAARDN